MSASFNVAPPEREECHGTTDHPICKKEATWSCKYTVACNHGFDARLCDEHKTEFEVEMAQTGDDLKIHSDEHFHCPVCGAMHPLPFDQYLTITSLKEHQK